MPPPWRIVPLDVSFIIFEFLTVVEIQSTMVPICREVRDFFAPTNHRLWTHFSQRFALETPPCALLLFRFDTAAFVALLHSAVRARAGRRSRAATPASSDSPVTSTPARRTRASPQSVGSTVLAMAEVGADRWASLVHALAATQAAYLELLVADGSDNAESAAKRLPQVLKTLGALLLSCFSIEAQMQAIDATDIVGAREIVRAFDSTFSDAASAAKQLKVTKKKLLQNAGRLTVDAEVLRARRGAEAAAVLGEYLSVVSDTVPTVLAYCAVSDAPSASQQYASILAACFASEDPSTPSRLSPADVVVVVAPPPPPKSPLPPGLSYESQSLHRVVRIRSAARHLSVATAFDMLWLLLDSPPTVRAKLQGHLRVCAATLAFQAVGPNDDDDDDVETGDVAW